MEKKRRGPRGPRGPSTKREVLDRIYALALEEPKLPAKKIREQLFVEAELEEEKKAEAKFVKADIPGDSSVAAYVSKARSQAEIDPQERPWSLAVMAKEDTGIPWEAVPFLMEMLNELRNWQENKEKFSSWWGEKLWPWSGYLLDHVYKGTTDEVIADIIAGREPEHISAESLQKGLPPRTILTVRQAKWLWRMDRIFPTNSRERFRELFERADDYAHQELLADYLKETFDTRELDEDLMLYLTKVIPEDNQVNKGNEE